MPSRKSLEMLSLVVLFGVLTATADAKTTKLEIGAEAPSWSKLPGTDGKQHSLADLKDSTAVVVVFTCNSCPIAKAYEERLRKLTEAYQDKGVAVVAINVNNSEDLNEMIRYAKKKKFNFPYVYDESQKIAKDFGATATPHAFLLDKQRKVAYMGAIDDDTGLSGKAQTQYLRDAIEAVLADKKPEQTITREFGCGIKWKR